ncbi:hypothetical protein KKF63_09135 [bacterium]|nr:hypothetical protein [bacterium]
MLEKYCDILIIGDHLPGLVTAAFLARRGLSVQVIDTDLFSKHPKKPDPVCLTNIHSNLLRSILGRLNVPEVTIQSVLNQDATLQYIYPKSRIDIFHNPMDYFDEVEREFKDNFKEIKRFYEKQSKLRHRTQVSDLFEKLIPHTWKERQVFKKFINEQSLNEKSTDFINLLKQDPRLKSFFSSQFLLGYQQFCDSPFAYQISALLNPGDGEIFNVYAGLQHLKKILHERITHYDGAVRNDVQINSLLFRNGIFEGLELDEAHGQILCKYVIWNDDLNKLKDLLPRKWRFRQLRKQCAPRHDPFYWFTTRFSVPTVYLPNPMRNNVIMINNPEKELIGDNFLYLQLNNNPVESETQIHVNFLLPQSALSEDEEFFDSYFEAIKQSMIKLMPFSDNDIQFDFPTKSKDMPTDTLFPLTENDFEIFRHAAAQNSVSHQVDKHFINLFKLDYRTPAPNFYLSHPDIFTAFGLDAKLMLGLKITDNIWSEVEKVKKRAMKTERRIA